MRGVHEACVFQALRERLRCKEIWVVGAHEWRNPDEDLPADFEIHRAEHYDKLRKPLDPTAFTAGLREECAPNCERSTMRCPDCRGCGSPTARAARSS
ncbi:MAG: hypothetical protein LC790_07825 [Actinobacteria bacterium]|nr:hypothetical protein [Actinomycetota bacterium]